MSKTPDLEDLVEGATAEKLRELRRFLHGEAPLVGAHFGDRHPTHRGPFWWRGYLNILDRAASELEAVPDLIERVEKAESRTLEAERERNEINDHIVTALANRGWDVVMFSPWMNAICAYDNAIKRVEAAESQASTLVERVAVLEGEKASLMALLEACEWDQEVMDLPSPPATTEMLQAAYAAVKAKTLAARSALMPGGEKDQEAALVSTDMSAPSAPSTNSEGL